jgi:hypothetical protein
MMSIEQISILRWKEIYMQYAVRIHLDIFFAVIRDCTRVVIFHLVPEE